MNPNQGNHEPESDQRYLIKAASAATVGSVVGAVFTGGTVTQAAVAAAGVTAFAVGVNEGVKRVFTGEQEGPRPDANVEQRAFSEANETLTIPLPKKEAVAQER